MKTNLFSGFSSLGLLLLLTACGGGGGGGGSSGSTTYLSFVHTCGTIATPASPVTAVSGQVTQYIIQSGLYSTTSGNYTTAMNATISFSTTTPLLANLINVDIASAIVDATIDDGLFSGTLGSTCLTNQPVLASTDASGNLTSLQIGLVYPQLPVTNSTRIDMMQFTYASGNLDVSVLNDALCTTVGGDGYCQTNDTPTSSASVSASPTIATRNYPTYSAIYVFGASTFDTGRHYTIDGIPASPYWEGRYSNGPSTPEYFEANIGIPIASRTDYAVGGALSGRGNYSGAPDLATTGMLDQLDTFTASLGGGSADANALYFITTSGNDFKTCGKSSCTNAQIDVFVGHIDTIAQSLSNLGARHIYVEGAGGTSSYATYYNSQLNTDITNLNGSIPGDFVFFDSGTAFSGGITTYGNPDNFTNNPPAQCYSGFVTTPGTVCSDVWTYVLWDQEHVTTRFAHFFGDKLSEFIKL